MPACKIVANVYWDAQNVFHAAKKAFGYETPNFDVGRLSTELCNAQGFRLGEIFFYTGIPERAKSAKWHGFWERKLAAIGRNPDVRVHTKTIRYHKVTVRDPCGVEHTAVLPHEKGIDVRIALDVVRHAQARQCDAVILLSQDQDLADVAREVFRIARAQNRSVEFISAFPLSPAAPLAHGLRVEGVRWAPMEKSFYDLCIDHRNYLEPAAQPDRRRQPLPAPRA
jgi:NYN domain